MTRVLWATQVYPRHESDVLGSFLHRLARELPPRGVAVRVVAPAADGVPAEETRDGVEIVRFRYAAEGKQTLAYTGEMHREARRHPWRFAAFLRAFRTFVGNEVRAQPPDVVHAHWWIPSGWAAAPAARAANAPLALSVHGTDLRLLSRLPLFRPLARSVVRRADLVLPVSRPLAARVCELGAKDRAVEVLPMPADAGVFLAQPSAPPSGPPRFVVAARLTSQKRVDVAIRAVASLRRQGIDVRLDVAGDGPERSSLENLVGQLGAGSVVAFHGMRSAAELASLYRAATAVVLSSEDEGYGLTIVEAALCGVPAIGARSGGIVDLVEPDVTGLLFEPGDIETLAAAMRELAGDQRKRQRMGRAAQDRARSVTPGPIADRLVSIYRRLVTDRRP